MLTQEGDMQRAVQQAAFHVFRTHHRQGDMHVRRGIAEFRQGLCHRNARQGQNPVDHRDMQVANQTPGGTGHPRLKGIQRGQQTLRFFEDQPPFLRQREPPAPPRAQTDA